MPYGRKKIVHLKIMLRFIAKIFFTLLLLASLLFAFYFGYTFSSNNHLPSAISEIEALEFKKLQGFAGKAKMFCEQKGYNTSVCFLVDMSLTAGKNRFFVFGIKNDSVINYGLVAHGCCNRSFLSEPKFSNEIGSGCSSLGRYKIGYKYKGQFGIAYKLYGLDSTNSNAYKRNIVLHSYYMVPNKEVNPLPICNSRGCIMVSDNYMIRLSKIIDTSSKPILLWVVE